VAGTAIPGGRVRGSSQAASSRLAQRTGRPPVPKPPRPTVRLPP